jgi:hypothetical protein
MPHTYPEAVAMFESGATAHDVAQKLRMKHSDVMAMKMEWLTAKQAPLRKEKPKAEKPAPKKKAKDAG